MAPSPLGRRRESVLPFNAAVHQLAFDAIGVNVFAETIYRTLFIPARGALKKELLQHLRRTRVMRRSRHHTQKTPITAGLRIRCRFATGRPRPRTGRCGSLGRRSVFRQPQQSDRHLRGAQNPLPNAGQGGQQQGHRDRGRCAHQAGAEAPSGALQVTDVRSWHTDGRPSALLAGDRRESLFLRTAAAERFGQCVASTG
jgi:hypothetical protein